MPLPTGLSAVIVVAFTTVKSVARFGPKSTAVAPVKPVPVIVTMVPPSNGPALGVNPVTLVGVIRSSSSSSPRRSRRLIRERLVRRRPFLTKSRDGMTNGDMKDSPDRSTASFTTGRSWLTESIAAMPQRARLPG